MIERRRRPPTLVLILLAAAIGAGCTFPPLATPTATPTASPTASPTPEASAIATPSPTPEPTADLGAGPIFSGGEIVETAIDGLRVRQRPGTTSLVAAGLLPLGAELEVIMGPIPVDDLAWYLVADADGAEPSFDEGWIAAGFEPEPFLRGTGVTSDESPVIATIALTGNAEHGPVEIGDRAHRIRWVALDPEQVGCRFGVVLEPARGDPVQAIRATIGNTVVPGTLQPSFFESERSIRGQVFVRVESDCSWALAVERVPPPEEDASPRDR